MGVYEVISTCEEYRNPLVLLRRTKYAIIKDTATAVAMQNPANSTISFNN